MNDYKCSICGNSSLLRTIPREVGGQVAECAVCGHLAVWPQPDNEAVITQYEESAFVTQKNVGTALFDDLAFKLLKKSDPRRNLTVLDVGCGLGEFIKKCAAEKHKVAGIEVTKSLVDQLVREGFEVYQKSLDEFCEPNHKRYDWVACVNVLEHLPDPLTAINNLADLVEKNGRLVIESPNGDCIAKYGANAYGLHVDKEHLNYLRPAQLIRLLEHHGLSLVYKKFYPSSFRLGRSNIPTKNAGNVGRPSTTYQVDRVYRKSDKPKGIRAVVENLPSGLRGVIRSIAQISRYIAAIDEVVTGNSHVFVIVMKKL